MARHKEDQREQVMHQTRQRLLEAATQEFAREGYIGANINHISKAAGFAKGTIYNYFPSKRALMLALIDSIAKMHLTFVVEQVETETDPHLKLERFFKAGFAFVSTYLPQARVLINTIYGPDEEFKFFTYQAYQPMFQFVSQDILAAGVEGGIYRPVDPVSTGTMLMTIYLATASQIDPDGNFWLDPSQVADFASHALHQ